MKKQSFFLAFALITAFFSTNAQVNPVVLSEKMDNEEERLAKNAPNLVLMAKLHKDFPNATEESWSTISTGHYVTFKSDGILHNVFLNKKGKITAQLRYLNENQLPKNVIRLIKGLDGCFTIDHCKEVITEMGKVYLVTINGDDYWKIVRINGDELDIYQEFKKG